MKGEATVQLAADILDTRARVNDARVNNRETGLLELTLDRLSRQAKNLMRKRPGQH